MIFRRVFRRIFGGNEWSDKGRADLQVRVEPGGAIHGRCHTCGGALRVSEDARTVWFHCETCARQSFYAAAEAERDQQRAAAEGEPVIFGLYYFDQLPDNVRPPQGWQ